MVRKVWVLTILLMVLGFLGICEGQPKKKVYIGGAFALTGAYAEDAAAILMGFEDYAKYVNETKNLAPWRKEKWPGDIEIEVLWRDDELKPAKALSIYEELKGRMLVFRVSGSPQALALKDKLAQDRMMATSMATGPYLMLPEPGTVVSYYPIYTDSLAAIADWFKENWKESRKPRVAYLTADNPAGKSIEIPQMQKYLEKIGYEFVGRQYVPLVPTTPPTTQLMWLKENRVDLALGFMVNPGGQPTIKEAVRLGMGPHLPYKIVFGFATPMHLQVFLPAMGELGEGVVVGGSFPAWDEDCPGIKFIHELFKKYRPTYTPPTKVPHVMYMAGIVEAMIQLEAIRLAMEQVPFEKLRPVDVLEKGLWRIKNLDTGGLTNTPLTYGPKKVEGIDACRVDQVRGGKQVKVGLYPLRHIY
jgi:branched-chain amino acid transport system substrate-binding protein